MIIACREKGWLDERADFRQWDHLCRSMGGEELQLVYRLEDIEFPKDRPIVILDESAETHLKDFVHPENAVYVFGRSCLNKMQDAYYSDYAVRVDTPANCNMFGVTVAAIVLYDRNLKRGN